MRRTRIRRRAAVGAAIGFNLFLCLTLLSGCASEPTEEPEPPEPSRHVPGAWIERRGGGVFQHLPESPRPRPAEEPKEAPPPSPYRPVELTLWSGEVIRGRLVKEDNEAYEVLAQGSPRRFAKPEVASVKLYPRNIKVMEEDPNRAR